MADRFLALDVETANPDFSSICSIGIVPFEDGREVDRWYSLVNPEDYFSGWNVRIHGITEADVIGAPTLASLASGLRQGLTDQIVVTHTHFDRAALYQAHEKYGIEMFGCHWLDSARVIRRAWPDEFAQSGYGLANAAHWAGIEFGHHNAEEDARASGLLVVKAIEESGVTVEGWLDRVRERIPFAGGESAPRSAGSISHEGNPDGPLHGEFVCFTGALHMPRGVAAAKAADAGCAVRTEVSKRTTILVVGQQDLRSLAGHEKSSKHRKAEALLEKGHPIRIIGERDFLATIGLEAGANIPSDIPKPIARRRHR